MSNVIPAIHAHLIDIRTHWRKEDAPARSHGPRTTPGPTYPGGAAASVRIAIHQDLIYWCRVLMDSTPADADQLDASDVIALLDWLREHLRHVSSLEDWQQAAIGDDFAQHAAAITALTEPPPPTILLGPCPRGFMVNGRSWPCGGELRANVAAATEARERAALGQATQPYQVACPQCGHRDTIEGWQEVIVGSLAPETTTRLIERLRGIGVRASRDLIYQWMRRGVIPRNCGTTMQGEYLWDPRLVIQALMAREDRKATG